MGSRESNVEQLCVKLSKNAPHMATDEWTGRVTAGAEICEWLTQLHDCWLYLRPADSVCVYHNKCHWLNQPHNLRASLNYPKNSRALLSLFFRLTNTVIAFIHTILHVHLIHFLHYKGCPINKETNIKPFSDYRGWSKRGH